MTVPILGAPADAAKRSYWQCPSCRIQHISVEQRRHNPMHFCPKNGGLPTAFVPLPGPSAEVDTRQVRHKLIVREDYVGHEVGIRYDSEGRPISAMHVVRADGSNDCHVFAPTASMNLQEIR